MRHSLVGNEDGTGNVTVVIDGDIKVARSDHPYYNQIVAGALAGDESIADLFDISEQVGIKFQQLTERITVQHGQVCVDGDEVDNSLTQTVLRFLDEGLDDWEPLALLFENVLANPQKHSRDQLHNWLSAHPSFTITKEGNILAYKGVNSNYNSIWSGGATVDGVHVAGKVPNRVGSTIEVPRSSVRHDPAVGCSFGLHVATHSFATGYGSIVLGVEVNPRDVVSVPTECDAEKMRVCRYKVRNVVAAPYAGVLPDDEYVEHVEL